MTYSPTLRKLGDLTLGVFLGLLMSLEAFLEPPGALLAASWSLFGRSWGGLGLSWAPLGTSWGVLGPLGRLLGRLGGDPKQDKNETHFRTQKYTPKNQEGRSKFVFEIVFLGM